MRALSRVKAAAAMALLFGATACADLSVVNPNDPDAGRALANAGDVESLIAGSFNTWFAATYDYNGAGLFLSNASFQHTAPWANAAMEFYGRLPRVGIVNDPADQFYGNFTWAWYRYYRSLAAVADGLRQVANNADIAEDLGDDLLRAQAYGKFVQGMSHAGLAILYDQGFIVDEDTDLATAQTAVDYNALMDAAMAYFDDAIALATGADFTIPASWMTADVTADQLVELRALHEEVQVVLERERRGRQAVVVLSEQALDDGHTILAHCSSSSSSARSPSRSRPRRPPSRRSMMRVMSGVGDPAGCRPSAHRSCARRSLQRRGRAVVVRGSHAVRISQHRGLGNPSERRLTGEL